MSVVRGLGYLGLESQDPAGWEAFATRVLGLMVAPHSSDGVVQLKLDEWPQRISVRQGEKDRLAYTGWEVANEAALHSLASELSGQGVRVEEAKPDELQERRVQGMLWCVDPSGFRVEFFHSPIHDHVRFVSPVGARFVTGSLGMGHVVLLCDHWEESIDFYVGKLGFRLSDSMVLDGRGLRFLRCNPRHHSLALAPHRESRLAHLMLEVESVDEVGYCIDRCAAQEVPIAMTLGRHTNDRMLSFYMRAPRSYEVEYGCEGIHVDESTWTTSEITRVSFWGHSRPG